MKEQADILFLCANPTNADRLELDREARTIQLEIEESGGRLQLATRWAAEPLDLLRELRSIRPAVLHFAGYGARGEDAGVYFMNSATGKAQFVSAEAIKTTISAAGQSVRVVVLNACYTEPQAAGLLDTGTVDCVIGVTGAIGEVAARKFALEFYRALAEGCSVGDAWARGCAPPEVQGHSERGRPKIQLRDGVDAGRLFVGR